MRPIKLLPIALLATMFLGIVTSPASAKNEDKSYNKNITRQQIRIGPDGKAQLDGLKVTAVSPTTSNSALPATITATSTWGSTVFTWFIKTSNDTRLEPLSGKVNNQIIPGGMLNVSGYLDTAQTAPTVKASWIKYWQISSTNNATSYRGAITELDTTTLHFVLSDPNPKIDRAPIMVQADSATIIKRGESEISFSDLMNGETASITGSWNNSTSVFLADSIAVKAPKPRIWNGVIKSITGTTMPTSLVATIHGTDHIINISNNTVLLNYWWSLANLADFKVGDRLQIFGSLLPNMGPLPMIAATVIRNLSLR